MLNVLLLIALFAVGIRLAVFAHDVRRHGLHETMDADAQAMWRLIVTAAPVGCATLLTWAATVGLLNDWHTLRAPTLLASLGVLACGAILLPLWTGVRHAQGGWFGALVLQLGLLGAQGLAAMVVMAQPPANAAEPGCGTALMAAFMLAFVGYVAYCLCAIVVTWAWARFRRSRA